jgi:hypothetical protein
MDSALKQVFLYVVQAPEFRLSVGDKDVFLMFLGSKVFSINHVVCRFILSTRNGLKARNNKHNFSLQLRFGPENFP